MRTHWTWLALSAAVILTSSTADAKNPIRRDFFDYYPAADGTAIEGVASNADHCGMCHYDFNGGGDRNHYGVRLEELRGLGNANETAFAIMESEDSDLDGFDNITEIGDTVNYPNTPTFPGLASADLASVSNIPLSEISSHVTPTATVDTDPPSVVITSPTAGSVLTPNTTVTVTYTATDPSDVTSILFELSDDGGDVFKPASFTLTNTGSYDWFVPARPGVQTHLRLTAVDGAGNVAVVVSDAFTIDVPTPGRVPTTLRDVDMPGTQPFEGPVLADPDDNCSTCHGDYDTAVEPWANWRGSMMSQAARDPLFYACLAIAEQDAPSVGDICIRCHAPRGWLAGRSIDSSGQSLTVEDRKGISCDFCHKLVDWNYTPGVSPAEDADILAGLIDPPTDYTTGQYVIAPTAAKRGPFADALEDGHAILESDFHRSSALCGTCHDVSNAAFSKVGEDDYAPNAFDAPHPTMDQAEMGPVERTFSEWEASDFATGGVDLPQYGGVVATCQDCHMSDVTGAGASTPGTPVRSDLPLHDMTGGNTALQGLIAAAYPDEVDVEQLNASKLRARQTLQKAIQLDVTPTGYGVDVRITNDTGHKLPTGYPEGRRVFISVEARNALDEVVFTSGAYDFATAELQHDPQVKIYEIKPGFSPALAAALSLPSGPSFHFVLNDSTFKDNRIPPRGFTNANFEALQMPPVDHVYADGQYWDDTHYDLPNTAATATVRVYYQAVSREYVEFLRDENTTNSAGTDLYALWLAHGMGAPELMAEETVAVNVLTGVDPTPGLRYALGTPAPNPVAHGTSFEFALAAPGVVDLAVFDVRGRKVRTLEDERRPAGRYTMHFDGRDDHGVALAAGVYFIRLASRDYESTQRVSIVR